jgi:Tol biopolymer transport system component
VNDTIHAVEESRIGVVGATGASLRWLTSSSDCDSTTVNVCVTTWSPAWSPDGKALVFARGDSLVLIGADGSGERTLTISDVANGYVGGCPLSLLCYAQVASLHWSPSDDEITFVDKAGNVELVRPDGSSVQTIVCHAFTGAAVDWSPTGDRLAFERELVNVRGPALWELVVEPLPTRSPPRSATSTASPRRASWLATAASACARTNPASATCADR